MSINQKIDIKGLARVSFLTIVLGLPFSPVPAASAQENQAEVNSILNGKKLSETNCSRCHSVKLEGTSPNANAPTFRNFSSYHDTESIYWLLLEGTAARHTGMPHFAIMEEQVRNITSWINWLHPIAHGKRLVQKNCSRCHAVDIYDKSAHLAAPPFRNLSTLYSMGDLEEALAQGIETDHPDMTVFGVTTNQLRDIVEYIETLQKSRLDN